MIIIEITILKKIGVKLMDISKSDIIIYQTEDGKTKIEVTMEGETVWLSQSHMCELFQRDKSVVSRHINNIFKEGELDKNLVVANFATTAALPTRGA